MLCTEESRICLVIILTSAFSQLVLEVDACRELLASPAASPFSVYFQAHLQLQKAPFLLQSCSESDCHQHTGTTGGEPHPVTLLLSLL